jgi:hypothetical protein
MEIRKILAGVRKIETSLSTANKLANDRAGNPFGGTYDIHRQTIEALRETQHLIRQLEFQIKKSKTTKSKPKHTTIKPLENIITPDHVS